MATKNNAKAATEAVTTRLTAAARAALLQEAEKQGSNPSRILAHSWDHYCQQQSIESRLAKLEATLTRRMFEIVCAVAGLDAEQRAQAMRDTKQHLREVA
ncbi:hypothetical protein MI353_09720 [Alteromonas sp. MCA-1]|uniref:hypothetical protein n=1 Tax=unclassified Alteromonas TaxID=2614992 RepID=UPI001EF79C49|nr:hypothetical protein [Alteromonas sp. MCA-1]MCG7813035.1 hypothetical protein [Alteromonas sp. MCA-1]